MVWIFGEGMFLAWIQMKSVYQRNDSAKWHPVAEVFLRDSLKFIKEDIEPLCQIKLLISIFPMLKHAQPPTLLNLEPVQVGQLVLLA